MELADIIAQALKIELDGRDFYRQAAQIAPHLAEVFERLARDEEQHYAYLERLQASAGVDAVINLEDVPPLDVADPIFPRHINPIEVLPANPTVNDALVFAMGNEMKSVQLYRQGAAQAEPGSVAQRLFTQLVHAEIGHYNVLMQRYEALNPFPA